MCGRRGAWIKCSSSTIAKSVKGVVIITRGVVSWMLRGFEILLFGGQRRRLAAATIIVGNLLIGELLIVSKLCTCNIDNCHVNNNIIRTISLEMWVRKIMK